MSQLAAGELRLLPDLLSDADCGDQDGKRDRDQHGIRANSDS